MREFHVEAYGRAYTVIQDDDGAFITPPEIADLLSWGTALKPAWEPIVVARKPLDGTNAANLEKWGVGALNIDGCRVEGEPWKAHTATGLAKTKFFTEGGAAVIEKQPHDLGRWPANLIHNGSDEVVAAFPAAPGQMAKAAIGNDRRKDQNVYGTMSRGSNGSEPRDDSGSAARFYYCAKASKADRDAGLEHLPKKAAGLVSETSGQHITRRDEGYEVALRANTHPTVKPTVLMQYLCRLVTPPGGVVLDPFIGSGSTGKAAVLEGFQFIGIEREAEYMPIAVGRISWAIGQMDRPDAPVKAKRRTPANDNAGHSDLFLGAA